MFRISVLQALGGVSARRSVLPRFTVTSVLPVSAFVKLQVPTRSKLFQEFKRLSSSSISGKWLVKPDVRRLLRSTNDPSSNIYIYICTYTKNNIYTF